MIKAIFIDFDGTLFSHRIEQIPKSTIKAIKLLNKKGIKSFLCTGRSPIEMTWFDLKDVELSGSILTNGQIGIDNNNKIVFSHPIQGELLDMIVDVFNKKEISTYLTTIDDIYVNFVNDAIVNTQKAVSSPVPPIGEYKGEGIYMASCFFENRKQEKEIYKLFEKSGVLTSWQVGAVDIVPKGISKAEGIDEMIKHYDINISETLAIGDGENDIEMLKHCGIGVAMGNSCEQIKNIADYITDDIDNDGLYNAMKHYNLI